MRGKAVLASDPGRRVMSSGDDPPAVDDRTVVSRGRGDPTGSSSSSDNRSRNREQQRAAAPSEATVISVRPISADDDRTMVAGGSPTPDWNPPDTDLSRTVIAAEPAPAIRSAEASARAATRMPADSVRVAGSGPILAAATPLLMLLGRLQQGRPRPDGQELRTALAAAMEKFQKELADADVPREDARKATYVLCDAADDMVGNLPGMQPNSGNGLLEHFFGETEGGVGFFETLNGLLAAPAPHHDLLQMMHACLSLGFKGQYRGRDETALERVRGDVHATLRYLEGDRRQPGAAMAAERPASDTTARTFPVWAFAGVAVAVSAAVYLTLLLLLTSEADRVAGKLEALIPARSAVIERGADGS